MKKVEYNLFSINSKERIDMIKGTDVLCLIASQGNTGIMISKDRMIVVSQPFKYRNYRFHGWLIYYLTLKFSIMFQTYRLHACYYT